MQFYNGGVVLVQECQAALIGYALWDSAPTSCGYDLLLATMQGQVDYVKKEFGIQVSYVTAIVCPTKFLMLLEFFFTNQYVELRDEFSLPKKMSWLVFKSDHLLVSQVGCLQRVKVLFNKHLLGWLPTGFAHRKETFLKGSKSTALTLI